MFLLPKRLSFYLFSFLKENITDALKLGAWIVYYLVRDDYEFIVSIRTHSLKDLCCKGMLREFKYRVAHFPWQGDRVTLMQCACVKDHVEIVKFFVENISVKICRDLFLYSVESAAIRVVKFFHHKNFIFTGDKETLLRMMVRSGNISLFNFLREKYQITDFQKSLLYLTSNNTLEMAELLISLGANVNEESYVSSHYSRTPLTVLASLPSSSSAMELLIKHGADVSSRKIMKAAILSDAVPNIRVLIQNGAEFPQSLFRTIIWQTPSFLEEFFNLFDSKKRSGMISNLLYLSVMISSRYGCYDLNIKFLIENANLKIIRSLWETCYRENKACPPAMLLKFIEGVDEEKIIDYVFYKIESLDLIKIICETSLVKTQLNKILQWRPRSSLSEETRELMLRSFVLDDEEKRFIMRSSFIDRVKELILKSSFLDEEDKKLVANRF